MWGFVGIPHLFRPNSEEKIRIVIYRERSALKSLVNRRGTVFASHDEVCLLLFASFTIVRGCEVSKECEHEAWVIQAIT